MPTSRKPKAAQHDPRIVVPSRPAGSTSTPTDEQRHALQMSMDTRQ